MASKIKDRFIDVKSKFTSSYFYRSFRKSKYGWLKSGCFIIGLGVFTVGIIPGILGSGGVISSLTIAGLAAASVSIGPDVYRTISHTLQKNNTKINEKKINTDKENVDDAWKEFEKAVREIGEKFSKDNRAIKTDYEQMKKYYDVLATKKMLDFINKDDIEFYRMYEETYNKQLEEFRYGIRETNEKELNNKLNKLKSLHDNYLNSSIPLLATINQQMKEFVEIYDETLNFATSIGKLGEFNSFVEVNDLKKFYEEKTESLKKERDNYEKKLEKLFSDYDSLNASINDGSNSKEELLGLANEFIRYFKEMREISIVLGRKDKFDNVVSDKGLEVFCQEVITKINTMPEKNNNVDKKLEILLIEYKKVLLLLRKDKKFTEKNIAELNNFTQLYNEVRDYCKSTKQENKFDRFIKENKFDVFAQLVGLYAYVQKTLTEKNKDVDIFVDAIHEDGKDVMADVYIKNGDTYTKESVSLNYRPKKDTNSSTIIRNIEDRIADRYFVSKNKVKVIKFNGKDYENIEDLNLEESSIRR